MKQLLNRYVGIALISLLLVAGGNRTAKAQDVTVSYQTFYDNLSPYGQWVSDPEYGNVWVPNEDGDFRPYGSRGHWVMTEYGNTWVSDDPWGWAVYHYGRWTYNPYYGWIWVPGYEWAPAWVSWRFGSGYSGWAPLGPGISVGVSYNAPESWWVFVGPQYMYQPNCIRYWRGPSYNTTYIRQTTIINNYYVDNHTHVRYNYGPRAEVVQNVTHQPVQVYRVSQLNRPGAPSISRNTVSIYRPTVNRATVSTARPTQVMQAPRPIGRAQAANGVSGNRAPAFRQDVQRQAPENRGGMQQSNPRATQPATQQQNNNTRQQPGNNQPERGRMDNNRQPMNDQNDTRRQQNDQQQRINQQQQNDTRRQQVDRSSQQQADQQRLNQQNDARRQQMEQQQRATQQQNDARRQQMEQQQQRADQQQNDMRRQQMEQQQRQQPQPQMQRQQQAPQQPQMQRQQQAPQQPQMQRQQQAPQQPQMQRQQAPQQPQGGQQREGGRR